MKFYFNKEKIRHDRATNFENKNNNDLLIDIHSSLKCIKYLSLMLNSTP